MSIEKVLRAAHYLPIGVAGRVKIMLIVWRLDCWWFRRVRPVKAWWSVFRGNPRLRLFMLVDWFFRHTLKGADYDMEDSYESYVFRRGRLGWYVFSRPRIGSATLSFGRRDLFSFSYQEED